MELEVIQQHGEHLFRRTEGNHESFCNEIPASDAKTNTNVLLTRNGKELEALSVIFMGSHRDPQEFLPSNKNFEEQGLVPPSQSSVALLKASEFELGDHLTIQTPQL